jgi:mRNA-degrading endonuclease RelE of RelBE toxin-antitoxin system
MIRTLRPIAILLLLLLSNQSPVLAQDTGSTLIVEVVNDAGQPIKDACVTFVPKTGDILFRKADRRGKVRMKRLHGGNYRVVVKVDGYEAQKKEVVVREAEGTLAFVMKAQN